MNIYHTFNITAVLYLKKVSFYKESLERKKTENHKLYSLCLICVVHLCIKINGTYVTNPYVSCHTNTCHVQ